MSTFSSGNDEGDKPPSPVPVLLLYNIVEQLDQGEARDLMTDQEIVHTAQAIADGLRSTGHDVTALPVRDEPRLRQPEAALRAGVGFHLHAEQVARHGQQSNGASSRPVLAL